MQNPVETVSQISKFLGKSLTDDQILKIVRMSRFEEMRNNNKVNYSWLNEAGFRDTNETEFLRKGKQLSIWLLDQW